MKTFNVEKIYTTKLSNTAPDVNDFTTDRVEYKSKDGTMIPMFVVRKKSVLQTINSKPEKPIPTLIHAYGGFGVVKTPYFSNSRLIWMNNMGGIFVYAGIRGGGEYGEMWHKAGAK
jgi:prolyl oligopeptidase